jgi:hypothetical protein
MDPNEPYSTVLNTSEPFRSVQQPSEEFSNLPSTSQRTSGVGRGKKYEDAEAPEHDIGHDFLIMEEAYTLFESKGGRRSMRSIGQYCKTGELICSYDSDDKRWHITRGSVEQKIAKIKAFNARRAATTPQNPQHTSEPFTEPPAAPQRPTEEIRQDREATPPPADEIKKLEQEIFDLKVLNKSKDLYIARLVDVNEKLLTRVETTSSLMGRLKERLLQLVAPETVRDIEVLTAPPDTTPDFAEANESPNEPLPNNAHTYEHSPQQP